MPLAQKLSWATLRESGVSGASAVTTLLLRKARAFIGLDPGHERTLLRTTTAQWGVRRPFIALPAFPTLISRKTSRPASNRSIFRRLSLSHWRHCRCLLHSWACAGGTIAHPSNLPSGNTSLLAGGPPSRLTIRPRTLPRLATKKLSSTSCGVCFAPDPKPPVERPGKAPTRYWMTRIARDAVSGRLPVARRRELIAEPGPLRSGGRLPRATRTAADCQPAPASGCLMVCGSVLEARSKLMPEVPSRPPPVPRSLLFAGRRAFRPQLARGHYRFRSSLAVVMWHR
jgi:hypothetical protein